MQINDFFRNKNKMTTTQTTVLTKLSSVLKCNGPKLVPFFKTVAIFFILFPKAKYRTADMFYLIFKCLPICSLFIFKKNFNWFSFFITWWCFTCLWSFLFYSWSFSIWYITCFICNCIWDETIKSIYVTIHGFTGYCYLFNAFRCSL